MIINSFEESTIRNERLPAEWQSQERLDELADFLQANWEQRAVFYDDGQVRSRQQFIKFLGQRNIRTQNYVGSIVFNGHKLNIFPKMFRTSSEDNDTTTLDLNHLMHNLSEWVKYCNRINFPYINISSDLEDATDLRELFISLYVRYVQAALERGLYYQYEDITEDRQSIRGKIDFRDYVVNKLPYSKDFTFRCTYSNFEFDNIVNKIIRYTCKSLLNDTNAGNRAIIRRILTKLNGITDVRCVPSDCDGIKLSRLNNHYSIIVSMSKMFLLNKEANYNFDNTESFCFLFPTDVLFEGFIGGFIKDVLGDAAQVTLQASDASVFSNVIYNGQEYGEALRMRHDILVEHREHGLFVLDTKYKRIDRFEETEDIADLITRETNSGDVYQVLTYARAREIRDVYLLYPLYRLEDIERGDVVGVNTTVNGNDQPVNVHFVRLPFVFEDDVENTKEKLRQVILRIFEGQQALGA